jgi:hypothetical protein
MRISVPSNRTIPIPRPSDGEAHYLHCTGGFRAARVSDDTWEIEPILSSGVPSARGFLSRSDLQELVRKAGLTPIAFQSICWTNGNYHSSWNPVIPKRQNHLRGPSDLWGSISTNLSVARKGNAFKNMTNSSMERVAKIIDDRTYEEALAHSISLSLRSMDISVEQIADFYNEQVVNLSAAGKLSGQPDHTTLDQTLFAHVHSFFLHLGAARDYLAAYIASKIGMDVDTVDDMARLVRNLRANSFGADPVLDQMREKGFLVPKPESLGKWEVAGWLKDASALRKQFVHKRPYGSKLSECFGWLIPVDQDAGLFRYFRSIQTDKQPDRDVLDEIVHHYMQCNEMFQDAAEISGQNTAIQTIANADIISVSVAKGEF